MIEGRKFGCTSRYSIRVPPKQIKLTCEGNGVCSKQAGTMHRHCTVRGYVVCGDVNVRFKLHTHTEEALLRCYTMRVTECGVGVGWGGMLT